MKGTIPKMIECQDITFEYNKTKALDDISFSIGKGVYGLIGENGAGKTTLLKLIMCLHSANKGNIFIDGISADKYEGNIGYLPQSFNFFNYLTVSESLDYIGKLKGINEAKIKEETDYWLYRLNLSKSKNNRVGCLSGGERQRLGIAQAFYGSPSIILLDEPTIGLDPKERVNFRNMINEFGTDKTIIISTHILGDIDAACENILVLKEGKLLYSGTTENFVKEIKQEVYTVKIIKDKLSEFASELDIISVKLIGRELELRYVHRDTSPEYTQRKKQEVNIEDADFIYTDMFLRSEERPADD